MKKILNNPLNKLMLLFFLFILYSFKSLSKSSFKNSNKKIIEKLEDDEDIYHKKLLENFRHISRNDLIKMINDSKLKYFRLKPQIRYIDDYFPLKYVYLFFKNLMESVEIDIPKNEEDNEMDGVLIQDKTLLICNESKLQDEFSLVPKSPFRTMALSVKKLIEKNISNSFDFKEILNQLEMISKSIGKKCKGHQKYLKKINKLINFHSYFEYIKSVYYTNKNKKKFDSKSDSVDPDLTKEKLRNFLVDLEINLRRNNFEKSGQILANVFNLMIKYNNKRNKMN